MSDEEEPTPEERAARRRASAQDAAADLARMGIDPRSLGLEAPAEQARDSPGPAHRSATPVDEELVAPSLDPPGSARSTGAPAAGPAARSTDPGETGDGGDAQILPLRPVIGADESGGGRPAPPGPGATVPAGPGTEPARRRPVAAGPLEQLLATTLLARPAPAAPGRLLRTVTRGLLTPDAAGAAGEERELVAAARSRQVGPRLVAVLAGKGGVGTTTVALGVASALAALREDQVVLADLCTGAASLGTLLTGEPAPSVRTLARDQHADAVQASGGLRVVDGVGPGAALRRADVAALLDRLGPEHAFCLLDVGAENTLATDVALARCDQAVLVTEAGRTGLGAARLAADRLSDSDPFAVDRAVHVVVCTRDEPYREVLRRARAQLEVSPARLVVVPPDPYLGAGEPFDAAELGAATREAMLQVTAAVALGDRTTDEGDRR